MLGPLEMYCSLPLDRLPADINRLSVSADILSKAAYMLAVVVGTDVFTLEPFDHTLKDELLPNGSSI